MANPAYITSLKLPITEKPQTVFSPEAEMIYTDIFNILNTFKIVLSHLIEEAPQDGKIYGRKNGEWVEIV